MRFIDLPVNKYFKFLVFNSKTCMYDVYRCFKEYPLKDSEFNIYNTYCLTTHKHIFVNPETVIVPMFE